MGILSTFGQISIQRHFKKITSCVDTVLVQLELIA
jgi:hypothetical protein